MAASSDRHRLAPVRAVPVLRRRARCRGRLARRSPTAPIRTGRDCRISATCCCATGDATGYVRVDWFTPDGLPHLGRRPAHHPRHRGLHRAAQIHRHRRPARHRPSRSSSTARASQHIDCSDVELPYGRAADRRRPQPHRDRDAAGALLQGHGAGADRAGDGGRNGVRHESKPRTVAVVGCGIGRSHIAEGYARLRDQFDVQVICDLSEERLATVGIAIRTRAANGMNAAHGLLGALAQVILVADHERLDPQRRLAWWWHAQSMDSRSLWRALTLTGYGNWIGGGR